MNQAIKSNAERYIMHMDGDAFFASVEVAKDSSLKGKPVVVGRDKSIATAYSYEAKALGVSRGMPIFLVKKICPQAIIVASDFRSYELYSENMFAIVERHVGRIQRYSIDECFADLGYSTKDDVAALLRKIQDEISAKLGITVSLGAGPTKVIAKLASKHRKPRGVTVINAQNISSIIDDTLVGKVWGIGRSSTAYLNSQGIKTVKDFIEKPVWWIEERLSLPMREIWRELRGESVFGIGTSHKDDEYYEPLKSISDTRSFSPFTNDTETLLRELSRHLEAACERARSHRLESRRVHFFIKDCFMRIHSTEILLPSFTNIPQDIMPAIRKKFSDIHDLDLLYRAAGVTLSDMRGALHTQDDLFGASEKTKGWKEVFKNVDALTAKFGDGAVSLATSFRKFPNQKANIVNRLPLPFHGVVRS